MRLKVMSENPISIMEYKRIIALAKTSKSLESEMYKAFPDRFKSLQQDKKNITIQLDKSNPAAHKYEMRW